MNSYIKQVYRTYSQYGIKILLQRIVNFAIFKVKRITMPKDIKNYEKFAGIKNKYQGKRIFIIGNGPSLNQMPLYLLKNEYTMCSNRFYLMDERNNWIPNFYIAVDDLVIKDIHEIANENVIPYVEYAFFPDIHPSNVDVKKKYIKNRDNVLWIYTDKSEFSDQMPNCGINKTVVNPSIQIAAWMGFEEIYLIGVDMTFGSQKVKKTNSRNWVAAEKDTDHFDPRYIAKGKAFHNPGVAEMLEKFEECKKFFDKRGVKIYNAGHGGKLETFPRVNFEEILNKTDEEQEQLFMQAIHQIDPNISLSDFDAYDPEKTDRNFCLPTEEGVKLIKDCILTHIPFGPYNGHYYFLKREKES